MSTCDWLWIYLYTAWGYYVRVMLLAYAASMAASVFNLRCGVLLRGYTEALLWLFEVGAKYAKVHEETETETEPEEVSSDSVESPDNNSEPPPKQHFFALRKFSDRQRRARTHSGDSVGQQLRQRVREPLRDGGLIHRDAVDALRQKLRRRTRSGPEGASMSVLLTDTAATTPVGGIAGRSCIDIIVDDSLDFIKAGFESIIQDEFNQAVEAEELPCWNLLSRNKFSYPNLSPVLISIWMVGVIWRYLFCFPVRMALFASALLWLGVGGVAHSFVSPQDVEKKREFGVYIMASAFRMFSKSMSCLITYHGLENRATKAALCVANHTSPIDCAVLSVEQVMALTGQKHTGILGYLESRLSALSPHLWFERTLHRDRAHVKRAIGRYVRCEENPPLLIFPEGVCVNNTAVVQFRKGAFEAVDAVRPIAVRYDAKFADAFWWQDTWAHHILHLMTSWALVVNVFYLPEMKKKTDQSPEQFADEVKAAISVAGGLRFLEWDGFLKMYTLKPALREKEKRGYFEHLIKNVDINEMKQPCNDISRNSSDNDAAGMPAGRRKNGSLSDSDAATQTDLGETDSRSVPQPTFGLCNDNDCSQNGQFPTQSVCHDTVHEDEE